MSSDEINRLHEEYTRMIQEEGKLNPFSHRTQSTDRRIEQEDESAVKEDTVFVDKIIKEFNLDTNSGEKRGIAVAQSNPDKDLFDDVTRAVSSYCHSYSINITRSQHTTAVQYAMEAVNKINSSADPVTNLNRFVAGVMRTRGHRMFIDKKPSPQPNKSSTNNIPYPNLYTSDKTPTKNTFTLASALSFISVKNAIAGRPLEGYLSPAQYKAQKAHEDWRNVRFKQRNRMKRFLVNYIRKFGNKEISLEELDSAFGTVFSKGIGESPLDYYKMHAKP